MLLSFDPIKEFIKQTDYQFYQNLVDVLIPDVLRPIPSKSVVLVILVKMHKMVILSKIFKRNYE